MKVHNLQERDMLVLYRDAEGSYVRVLKPCRFFVNFFLDCSSRTLHWISGCTYFCTQSQFSILVITSVVCLEVVACAQDAFFMQLHAIGCVSSLLRFELAGCSGRESWRNSKRDDRGQYTNCGGEPTEETEGSILNQSQGEKFFVHDENLLQTMTAFLLATCLLMHCLHALSRPTLTW